MRLLLALLAVGGAAVAQQPCATTPTFTPCDFVFELNDAEAAAHSNPYVSVQLHAEFRSPRAKTYLMPGFWAGGRKMIIRFAPVEPGDWTYRVTSNVDRFNGQTGGFAAPDSKAAGFIRSANLHHWATLNSENINLRQPHLWMGETCYQFAFIDRASFDQWLDARVRQKFTHIRGLAIGWEEQQSQAYPSPDRPNPEFFAELDSRMLAINAKGIAIDLVLAGANNALTKAFPSWQDRERYIRYLVARYSSLNITWQGVHEWETYTDGKALLKEVGLAIKKMDPFNHPRSSDSLDTSSSLAGDQWMHYVAYQNADDQLGAIEHQLYPAPFVQLRIGYEDSGAGKAHPQHVDFDTLRKRLWNSTMNGQYPTYGNTGTYDGRKIPFSTKYLESPGTKMMTAWFTFFDDTRHWELEPYFDVDGGRALALEGVEYVVYVEHPGPVEVAVEKHGYDVRWFNPATGEFVEAKKFKGDRYAGEPPDRVARLGAAHLARRQKRRHAELLQVRFAGNAAAIAGARADGAEGAVRRDGADRHRDRGRQGGTVLDQAQARHAGHAQHDVPVDRRGGDRRPRRAGAGRGQAGHADGAAGDRQDHAQRAQPAGGGDERQRQGLPFR